MIFFSTTLILASACLLVHASIFKGTVTTCEESAVQRLSCDSGSVISVETAVYGRTDSVTCIEGKSPGQVSNTACSAAGVTDAVTDAVKKRCNGKKVCELIPNALVGSDPCKDTAKYLQTSYTCLPAFHRAICEHSLSNLRCDEGQVIVIYGADYGRRDQNTCAYGLTARQMQDTACYSPTSSVAESCQGKNSCTVVASNSVFGDPCRETVKYLEVAYACQYPAPPDDQI